MKYNLDKCSLDVVNLALTLALRSSYHGGYFRYKLDDCPTKRNLTLTLAAIVHDQQAAGVENVDSDILQASSIVLHNFHLGFFHGDNFLINKRGSIYRYIEPSSTNGSIFGMVYMSYEL